MSWLYKKEILTDDMIPAKAVGFIYIITDNETRKRYIGRKLLTKAHTRQKNKKIIKTRVESDWRDYWSSSPELTLLIEENGTDRFTREILMFAETKGLLNYLEERIQYSLGVLESEDWLNTNIRAKMFKRNIIGKTSTSDINEVLDYINGQEIT